MRMLGAAKDFAPSSSTYGVRAVFGLSCEGTSKMTHDTPSAEWLWAHN